MIGGRENRWLPPPLNPNDWRGKDRSGWRVRQAICIIPQCLARPSSVLIVWTSVLSVSSCLSHGVESRIHGVESTIERLELVVGHSSSSSGDAADGIPT